MERPELLDTWRALLPLSHKGAGGSQKHKAYAQSRPVPRAPEPEAPPHSPPFPSKAGGGSRPLPLRHFHQTPFLVPIQPLPKMHMTGKDSAYTAGNGAVAGLLRDKVTISIRC